MTKQEALAITLPYLISKLQNMAESELEADCDLSDASFEALDFGREMARQAHMALTTEQDKVGDDHRP